MLLVIQLDTNQRQTLLDKAKFCNEKSLEVSGLSGYLTECLPLSVVMCPASLNMQMLLMEKGWRYP